MLFTAEETEGVIPRVRMLAWGERWKGSGEDWDERPSRTEIGCPGSTDKAEGGEREKEKARGCHMGVYWRL
jgi:hypothetical protein